MAVSNDVPNLTDLNYDCLREIFKFLSIEEAFSLIGEFNQTVDEAASERIAEIKEFRIKMRFPPKYSEELYQLMGKSIRILFISAGYSIQSNHVVNILRPLCTAAQGYHLTTVTINYICFDEEYLNCLLPLASQLKVLDLCNSQLTDKWVNLIIRTFKQLHIFNVTGNVELSEFAIQEAENIKIRNKIK